MERMQRRGVIYDAHAAKLDPEDVFQIRRSGLLLMLSTLIQLFALLIFIVIPNLFHSTFFAPYAGYIILLTVFCGSILQLVALLTGVRSLTSFSGSGRGLLWLSVIALMIATACIPLSLLLSTEGPIWFVLGTITLPFPPSNILVFYIWHAAFVLSVAGYSLSFGYLLITHDTPFGYGDLTSPGIFLLLQGSLQVTDLVLVNLVPATPSSLYSLSRMLSGFAMFFAVFMTVVWFLYLGYQFRHLPFTAEGDGWDRLRRNLSENPSVQVFLGRRMLGIIALILAAVVMIEVIADSILQLWYFGSLWWLAAIAIILGFSSLKFEHANGYAITALGLASLCWVVGAIISIQIHYYL